jgi:hypothetical protein
MHTRVGELKLRLMRILSGGRLFEAKERAARPTESEVSRETTDAIVQWGSPRSSVTAADIVSAEITPKHT